ncbi:MAG: hypothetical protein AAF726_23770 [Planctomycetota bacterium]
MPSTPRTARLAPRAPLLALALFAAACGGGSKVKSDLVFRAADTGNPDKWAFHRLGANDRVIECEAQIDTNPKGTFDFELSRRFNVVPIRLTVTLVSPEHVVRLNESNMQPILFLENGTALSIADPDALEERVKRKYKQAFRESLFEDTLLQSLGQNRTRVEGYLFFELPRKSLGDDLEFVVEGASATAYEIDLHRSLVQFGYDVTFEGRETRRTINVGTK